MILIFFLITYTIIDIDIEAQWTDPQLILQTTGLKIEQELCSSDIQNAITNLTRLKLFNYVAVDTSIVGDGIFVTITVDEAPFLKSQPQFIGNEKINDQSLLKKLNVRIGQVMTNKTLFELKNIILELYKGKSFYNSSVLDSTIVDSLNEAELYFIIEEGIQPRIGRIEITGNNAFSDDRIRKMMQNKPKAFLRSGKLNEVKLVEDIEKIRSFYREKGYLDVSVEDPMIEVMDNTFIITINIKENDKYYVGDIEFEGNAIFSTQKLEETLKLSTGDVYNLKKAEETLQNLTAMYAEEGYLYTSIIPNEDVRDSFVDIHYLINERTPATINRILITGNNKTRENVIRRELTTIPGERFRRSDVVRSLREVFNLGFFEDIQPITGTPDDSGNIDLIYQVKEKEGVATVGVGLSYSAQDNLTGYLELAHPNLFGRGQQIHTKLEIGGSLTSFQIGFIESWLFNTRTTFGCDVYYTNRLWDYYTKRDLGVTAYLSFPFYLDYTQFSYGLLTEQTQVLDIDESYEPPSSGYSLYDDTIPAWTIANSFGLVRDSRDYIFNASKGSYLALKTEIAKKFLFADVDYNKVTLEARAYFPIFWKFVLMGRVKAGVVTSIDEVPYYKRFYAGGIGDYGVRGYSDRSLSPVEDGQTVGGNAVLINNIEMKLKASHSWAFLLFYDAGNAFPTYKDIDLHNMYRGIGAGVRFEIPMMGRIGFDIGYGLDRESPGPQFHFQINPLGMF